MNETLYKLYEEEHKAIHQYLAIKIMSKIVEMKPTAEHEAYCDLIDAHDAIIREIYKDDMTTR